MNYDIFISYRRAGGEDFARAVYQELIHRKFSVFLDRQSLGAGDYEKQVMEVISRCRDVIVVLPPGALDRCGETKDLFRKEIALAIHEKKNIIPIVRQGFSFPKEDDLPEEIRSLLKHEAIIESPESYDAVIERLKDMLDHSSRLAKRKTLGVFLRKAGKGTAILAASGVLM